MTDCSSRISLSIPQLFDEHIVEVAGSKFLSFTDFSHAFKTMMGWRRRSQSRCRQLSQGNPELVGSGSLLDC